MIIDMLRTFRSSVKLIGSADRRTVTGKAGLDAVQLLTLPARLYLLKAVIDSIQTWGQQSHAAAFVLPAAALAAVMTVSAFVGSSSLLMHTRLFEIGTLEKERAIARKTARLPLQMSESAKVQTMRSRALLHSPDTVVLEGIGISVQMLQTVVLLIILASEQYYILSACLLGWGIMLGWLYVRTDERTERSQAEQASAFRMAGRIHRALVGKETAKEIRLFDLSAFLQRRWLDYYEDGFTRSRRWLVRGESVKLVPELSLALLGGASVALVLLADADIQRTAGHYVMLFQCTTMLAGSLSGVVRQFGGLAKLAARGADYERFMELEEDFVGERRKDAYGRSSEGFGIRAEGVVFRYEGHGGGSPQLGDVHLQVMPGATVAIVGENGSGKSTLAKLLLGLYRPDEGNVTWTVNGNELPAGHPSCPASAVFQDFTRYRLSWRHNVAVGDTAKLQDDEAIRSAMRKGGAAVLADRLDEQAGTEFGQSDASGGQWQAVAAARGLLGASGFIVFDEPTSALDPAAEWRAMAAFVDAAAGRTAVLITHRLGAAKLADTIVVLKEGRIVEQGTHEQLLELRGEYARMYGLQSAWYA